MTSCPNHCQCAREAQNNSSNLAENAGISKPALQNALQSAHENDQNALRQTAPLSGFFLPAGSPKTLGAGIIPTSLGPVPFPTDHRLVALNAHWPSLLPSTQDAICQLAGITAYAPGDVQPIDTVISTSTHKRR